mmetsp:Transcript_13532/g.33226  ORF Transcript_13532/g.33226 Transcript_13532/m.33226 type:complete len:634 (+) Transcript_13532:86-1987(+)
MADESKRPSAAVELEHLCGLTNRFPNTVVCHPTKRDLYLYPVGCCVVMEDLGNPHNQDFLRAHDADVSAICISQNGKMIASGQRGSERRKGQIAPVIVWDEEQRSIYKDFGGLTGSVICLSFSPDGRFLVGTGANARILIWDVTTGEVVYDRNTETVCYMAVWGDVIPPTSGGNGNRYPSYLLCTTYESEVLMHNLVFDIRSMSYVLETVKFQLPPSGLHRKHVCGCIANDQLITGTQAGDLCVFNLTNRVFRCSLPIVNGGVSGITKMDETTVILTGGDGKVKRVKGSDTHWDMIVENILEAPCVSVTLACDHREVLVSTKNGKIWRCLTKDLTTTLHSASHTLDVAKAAFGGKESETMVTVSKSGELFLWDLSDYSHQMSVRIKSPILCVCVSEVEDEILCGCEDSFMRAYRLSRRAQNIDTSWQIADAHRGKITAIKEWAQFIVTGGEDCFCRVWHRRTREMLAQYHVHRKPVSDIVIDIERPNLFHSGSEDRFIVTYDVKLNKSIVQRTTPNSNVTGLSQRKDCEREVVSCGLDGRILFWDIDVTDPVGCFHERSCKYLCIEVAPSGQYIAAGSEDGFLYVFDLETSAKISQLEGHSGAVTSVVWSPDMRQIVTTGADASVCVWNFFEL